MALNVKSVLLTPSYFIMENDTPLTEAVLFFENVSL